MNTDIAVCSWYDEDERRTGRPGVVVKLAGIETDHFQISVVLIFVHAMVDYVLVIEAVAVHK